MSDETQSDATEEVVQDETNLERPTDAVDPGEYDVVEPDDDVGDEDASGIKDESADESADDKKDTEESDAEKADDDLDASAQADRDLIAKFSTPLTDETSKDESSETVPDKETKDEKPDEEEAEPSAEKDDTLDFELDDDVDPEIVEAFGKLKSVAKGQRDDLKSAIGKIDELTTFIVGKQQSDAAVQYSQFCNTLDSFVGELGPNFVDTFGEGTMTDLPEGSPAIAARVKLKDAVVSLWTGYHKTMKPESIPSQEEIFKRALAAEFGKKVEQVTKDGVAAKVNARNKGATHRPTSRKGKQLSGEEAAIKRSRDLDKAMGDDGEETNEEF